MFIVGKCVRAGVVVIVPADQAVCTSDTNFLSKDSKKRMRDSHQRLVEAKQIVSSGGSNIEVHGAPPEIAEHIREIVIAEAESFIVDYGNTIDRIHDVSQVKLSTRIQDEWYCFIDYELCATFAEALACSKTIQS